MKEKGIVFRKSLGTANNAVLLPLPSLDELADAFKGFATEAFG